MSFTDPAHSVLGYVPASEATSLGPTPVSVPVLGGAYYYAGYKEDATKYAFLEAAYKGGPKFKEGYDRAGKPIFYKHERESDVRFERRRALTTYRNYVGPIVDQFTTYIGSSKVVRSPRKEFTEWTKNVDGAGSSMQEFMTHALTKLCLLGRWVVGAQLPVAPDTAVRTKATDTRVPYLVHVHPANIVDFAMDAFGRFTRLVVHHEIRVKATFGKPESRSHEYHEWTDSTLTIYKPQNPPDTAAAPQQAIGDGTVMQVSTPSFQLVAGPVQPNTYGRIPYVMIEIFEGKGIVEDVAECNKTILNLVGLLYEELYNQTFSQTWVSGAEDNAQGEIKKGTNTVIFLQNPEAKIHTTGANTEQASSIMNALHMEVKEIHRMAHMEQSGEPLQKRVAEAASKVEKSHESMDQALEQIADRLQTLENLVLGIAATYKTTAVADSDVATIWPRIFDTKTLREKISLAIEAEKIPFAPKRLLKGIAEQIAVELVEDPERLAEASKELEDAVLPRTAQEAGISKMLQAAGVVGPVELYKQFVDSSKSDDEIRKILDAIVKDREKYAPMQETAGEGEGLAKPANRPEKQPTPEEQRKATETQQAANQA